MDIVSADLMKEIELFALRYAPPARAKEFLSDLQQIIIKAVTDASAYMETER